MPKTCKKKLKGGILRTNKSMKEHIEPGDLIITPDGTIYKVKNCGEKDFDCHEYDEDPEDPISCQVFYYNIEMKVYKFKASNFKNE